MRVRSCDRRCRVRRRRPSRFESVRVVSRDRVQWRSGAWAYRPLGVRASASECVRVHARKFTIVEDGDRKGFQSSKGKAAKAEAQITSFTLPPRSPSLMPLDYSIWKQIDSRMCDCEATGRETQSAFLARLKKCARALPKSCVRATVRRMRANLDALVEAKGHTPKND